MSFVTAPWFLASLISALLSATIFCPTGHTQSQEQFDHIVSSSGYIFSGTLVGTSDPKRFGREAPQPLMVIRVETVMEIPSNIRLAPRDKIILLPATGTMKSGETAVFFAQTLELGKNLLLKEVARDSTTPHLQLVQQVADAHRRIADRLLRTRLETSTLVVLGQVIEITNPRDVSQVFTEHDPVWLDATIRIQQVLKGDSSRKTVVLRFPSSIDIAWVSVPKFTQGQTAIWLLHNASPNGKVKLPEQVFLATDPLDLEPTGESERLRKLMAQ